MFAQVQIDPNDLIDMTGIGWQEGIMAGVVVVVSVIVAVFLRRLVRTMALRWSHAQPRMALFLSRLVGWFVILLGVVAALMILGFQLGPMFLILGLVIVVLFLSARSLLENFGAGIVLQTETPFHLGDLVEIAGERGSVIDITGRTTVIDTIDGRRVRVPNSAVLADPIINYAERRALRSELAVGVEYGTDLDRARTVILECLQAIDGIKPEPPPEAVVTGFGDSSITFRVMYWHEPNLRAGYHVTDEAARAIDRAFRADGIVIAFPQLVVWRQSSGSNEEG